MITFSGLGNQGRFANQLFQIASTIGIAIKNGHTYGFPEWRYGKYFKSELHGIASLCEYSHFAESGFHYSDISIPDNTDISGYFQSEKYFKHCEYIIREQFEFKPEFIEPLKERYSHLLSNSVAIHVRRTDYVTNRNHLALPYAYYNVAMRQFPNQIFVVFSDDIDFCKKTFSGNIVYASGRSDIEDFALMTLFKRHIIANSSFSWWSAWLSKHTDKKVIAPKAWFGPGLKHTHNTQDLIPERWIRI